MNSRLMTLLSFIALCIALGYLLFPEAEHRVQISTDNAPELPDVSAPLIDEGSASSSLGLQLFQGGKRIKLSAESGDEKTVLQAELQPEPFQIRVLRYPSGGVVQINAWTDNSNFTAVKIGEELKNIDYFAPGTGMAAQRGPSYKLVLKKDAQNYLIDDRLESFTSGVRGITVEKFGINREEYAVSRQKIPVYLVVLIDSNRNKIIDEGELDLLSLQF